MWRPDHDSKATSGPKDMSANKDLRWVHVQQQRLVARLHQRPLADPCRVPIRALKRQRRDGSVKSKGILSCLPVWTEAGSLPAPYVSPRRLPSKVLKRHRYEGIVN